MPAEIFRKIIGKILKRDANDMKWAKEKKAVPLVAMVRNIPCLNNHLKDTANTGKENDSVG